MNSYLSVCSDPQKATRSQEQKFHSTFFSTQRQTNKKDENFFRPSKKKRFFGLMTCLGLKSCSASHSLSLSLSHTHSQTLTHTHKHSQTLTHRLSLPLSFSHALLPFYCTFSLSLALTLSPNVCLSYFNFCIM